MTRIKKNIVKKFYGEDIIAGLSKESMEQLGVEDEDWIFVQKGVTGMTAARVVVKEDPDLTGKNEIGISDNICDVSGLTPGAEVTVWKHDSWH